MPQDRSFVPEGGHLPPGEFYLPRLGRLHSGPTRSDLMERFVARFRALFDAEIYVPKVVNLSAFELDVANCVHILVCEVNTGEWRFARFAPKSAESLGQDLTGAKVTDPRFEEYGFAEILVSLEQSESPVLVTIEHELERNIVTSQHLFIPASNNGRRITHCLVLSVSELGGH